MTCRNRLLKIDHVILHQKHDYQIKEEYESLRLLLNSSFEGYFSERIYYKQIPTLRLLATYENQLIGQVAIIHRAISVDGQPIVIFGISDLCVLQCFRSQGIGTFLLDHVEKMALKHNIFDIVAFADDTRLYISLGYNSYLKTKCRFLAIDELRSHSVIERAEPSLLIKSFKNFNYSNRVIDLLGHLF